MKMGDGMMWGMGIWGFALAVLVVLVVAAALVKYIFFRLWQRLGADGVTGCR